MVRDVIRLRHYAYKTEKTYAHWIGAFCDFALAQKLPRELPPAGKMEAFLSSMAKRDCAASTQNQAFNALLFLFRDVLKQEVGKLSALRAKRPAMIRYAPSVAEVSAMLKALPERSQNQPVGLIVRLLYGCGLRVSEPLELRIKDVALADSRLIIRGAKGGKDRVVALPCSLMAGIVAQMAVARASAARDAAQRLPVQVPHLIGKKYPSAPYSAQWAFLFPSDRPCRHPRTGEMMRWRCHEQIVQRAVRETCAKLGLGGMVTPHCLRHAYATHALNAGANVRAVQGAMGHSSIETTMGYLHAESIGVRSPLDLVAA